MSRGINTYRLGFSQEFQFLASLAVPLAVATHFSGFFVMAQRKAFEGFLDSLTLDRFSGQNYRPPSSSYRLDMQCVTDDQLVRFIKNGLAHSDRCF